MDLIYNHMKKLVYTLFILTAIAAASCNSEQRPDSSADSALTDTAVMDSPAVDSLDVVDSLGLGTTPGTRPNQ